MLDHVYPVQMEECAEKLIKAGVLYADDTPVEKMREARADSQPSVDSITATYSRCVHTALMHHLYSDCAMRQNVDSAMRMAR